MLRNDIVYINTSLSRFSIRRIEGYTTFSENIQLKFPGYVLA